MIFQCLRRVYLYASHQNEGCTWSWSPEVWLSCFMFFSWIKCWWSSKLIEEIASQSPNFVASSGWRNLNFLFDKCVKIVVAFYIAYDFTSKEAIKDRLMWVARKSVQELSSFVFFVWHLISRVPVSSNRFPELGLGIGSIGPKPEFQSPVKSVYKRDAVLLLF